MAKLKNITEEEFKEAERKIFEVTQIAAALHHHANLGYADPVSSPLSLAASFASASRTLAELSAYFLMKAGLDEQRRELEAELKKRSGQ